MASDLYQLKPWSLMRESDLVLSADSATGHRMYCSVMGALGEVFAVHAYQGAATYRLFREIDPSDAGTVAEFFGIQESVYVEFAPSKELTPPDRKLLTALDHPLRSATTAPVFRSIRPGYQPWYVTEQDAGRLADALFAVLVITSMLIRQPKLTFWSEQEVFPQVTCASGEQRQADVELKRIGPDDVGPTPREALREKGAAAFCSRKPTLEGTIEVDYFLTGAIIGRKKERKAWIQIALAVDAETGIAFPPEIVSPGSSAGEALFAAILKASESRGALPKEVRVRSARFEEYLSGFAEVSGVSVRVVESLPSL
ncbi:MAG: hypothetical protein H0X25_18995, partial [Acidobacteriales bacterium]|nr:hypothetical protein [Terriglobales bacterium]